MKPESYREQSSCVNCKHVFTLQEWDEGETYYCHKDGSKRPRCGSCYMSESFSNGEKMNESFEERQEKFSKR
jgi:hypothetical protein